MGNNNTPLAEISITNHRSKKGAIGFYARHYSSNGKVPLENDQRVFAGFMDNDASLFGKKFFGKSLSGYFGKLYSENTDMRTVIIQMNLTVFEKR